MICGTPSLHIKNITRIIQMSRRRFLIRRKRLYKRRKYRLVWLVIEEDKSIEIEYIGPKAPELYEQLGLGRPDAE